MPKANSPAGSSGSVAASPGNANVWFFRRTDSEPEILFQKRSKFVDGNPGKYDVSAGGHIDPSETPLEGALRETREELGVDLSPSDLKELCVFDSGKIFHVFAVDWTGKSDAFSPDPKEVESVTWVPLSRVNDFVATKAKKPLQKNFAQLALLKMKILNGDN